MNCLDPESLVAYVRGRGTDPRGVEAHVRGCPACAFELLLTRETLRELRARTSRPATDRLRLQAPRPRLGVWIPWVAAAAVLVAALVFAVASFAPAPQAPPVAVRPKAPPPAAPKPVEEPRPPAVPVPAPVVPVPAPAPVEPRPPQPRIEPKPEPKVPVPEKAEPKPEPPAKPPAPEPTPPAPSPKPEPEPKKPVPTLVETAVVARVVHSIGGAGPAAGRVIRAGEALATARAEFLHVAMEGYGHLYLRENSQAEIGAGGEVVLHEGELLARLDPGKKLASIRTPAAPIDAQAPLVNVLAGKASTEVSILSGRVMMASASSSGPSTVVMKNGKAAEVRPLEAGFASWLPDRLASKKFTGWYEAEEFPGLQGFKAMAYEQASGRQAAVQVADQAELAYKGVLPFKGRHAVWLRVRQHEAKAAVIGIHLNGQALGEVKLDGSDRKAWRWVGPLVITGDRLDLGVSALSRWPLKEGEPARSFPVVVDLMLVTSDLKMAPPEKFGDDTRGLELGLDDPVK